MHIRMDPQCQKRKLQHLVYVWVFGVLGRAIYRQTLTKRSLMISENVSYLWLNFDTLPSAML